MQSIKNKITLITGASSGIGEACARLFAANGAKLILCARREERIKQLASELENVYETDCLILPLDVRRKDEVIQTLGSLPSNWQNIDILINNAGLALSSDPVQHGSFENWDTMIDTNVKGLLYVSKCILPGMINRNRGHIVNIGSIAGQECYPAGNVYCASKHAVRAISKSMRLDLLGTPIRVTEIAPGAVETEFSEVRWGDKSKAKAFYQDFAPLLAEDIADAIYYCTTRPLHVDVTEMTILPTAQASANHIHRGGK
ncbi:SDR family oxidoreductase [Legionella hackeliae]|uniref:NADP-dependent L-serine/L-allo-threonine dehydrogenase ydfG n=1 Tax=Legionella hackeliae TaxID=449 RepID=A0A0A8UPR2_LEGHA|nr:SDR family oxidoreductase [Legionella hackeliae]KTD11440.1 NADP-dependent L-serine/L-allo-threonine dehydrogenase ydfG [Legionella hackeliae]CEK10728.1 NADP-dependent L-serine/L-allo-threonine dehydrogenase ydfG [Legionella hackeliae]STX47478.1 L-allo-threonine dehydrogenase, NAD(P)-binding [Legionella hackeliae]